jgi:hypothetical protein
MTFDDARRARLRAIADAVLLEGYVLYPYRATSTKNRFRFAFGVLAPRTWSEGPAGAEPWWMETQCLISNESHRTSATLRSGDLSATLDGRLRFLQVCRRTVERAVDPSGGRFETVDSLEVDGELVLAWDEGELREQPLPALTLETLAAGEVTMPFELPASEEIHPLYDRAGALIGRMRRSRCELRAELRLALTRTTAADPLYKLSLRTSNVTPFASLEAPRELALRASLASAHLMLSLEGGAFVSLLDPPAFARAAAAGCRNVGTYPVLAGDEGEDDLLLSAPIILYDHPRIAPESPGDFFDATEIDELLQLRTATLTDEEKRVARATDPRAAAIVDRVERLPNAAMERLHGAIRELEVDAPGDDPPVACPYPPGTRVRIRPGLRRTDAQDLLFVGRVATVEKVLVDIDGSLRLAITLDDDPAADLHRWYGRFHHYRLDEVEPLTTPEEASP